MIDVIDPWGLSVILCCLVATALAGAMSVLMTMRHHVATAGATADMTIADTDHLGDRGKQRGEDAAAFIPAAPVGCVSETVVVWTATAGKLDELVSDLTGLEAVGGDLVAEIDGDATASLQGKKFIDTLCWGSDVFDFHC